MQVLMEFGLTKPSPIRLDQSIFLKNRLILSDNARRVLRRRYLKKDSQGKVTETPDRMFQRVARHIAKAEKKFGGDDNRVMKMQELFYQIMTEFKFLPNSPTLMNAGRRLGQLAACFVLPVEDSMEGIFGALRNAALIHKSGGGTGFSFSKLRPSGDVVATTMGVTYEVMYDNGAVLVTSPNYGDDIAGAEHDRLVRLAPAAEVQHRVAPDAVGKHDHVPGTRRGNGTIDVVYARLSDLGDGPDTSMTPMEVAEKWDNQEAVAMIREAMAKY